MNETIVASIKNLTMPRREVYHEVTYTQQRLFNMPEIVIISGLFILLSYWYIKVTKNKELYERWVNPNGKEINLYKIVRRIFWAYVATIIVMGGLTILVMPR
jgi:hypothetical protein